MFFNVSDQVVQKCMDVVYGKQIQISTKEKPRIVWFLNKLGVKWQECDYVEESSKLSNPVSEAVRHHHQQKHPEDEKEEYHEKDFLPPDQQPSHHKDTHSSRQVSVSSSGGLEPSKGNSSLIRSIFWPL